MGFRCVVGEDPVIWTSDSSAVAKLNGIIIPLQSKGGGTYATPGKTMTIRNVDDPDWRGGA
ncbi:hypothetical protein [Roseovarius sp. D0-M9]|uniref:hypothetical protein n=1 Tax=Roseovarius sp. D0-M9 TaxID=3127117 RepID=UPI00300FAAAB